jgi:hypothetical protein
VFQLVATLCEGKGTLRIRVVSNKDLVPTIVPYVVSNVSHPQDPNVPTWHFVAIKL